MRSSIVTAWLPVALLNGATVSAAHMSKPQSSSRSNSIECTACGTKPGAFFLAGDSTTAVRGGWGDGFLTFLQSPAWGINYGHSGATTASFVAGGDWAKVISSVKNNTAKAQCFVTIQFGHNDQKEKAGISIAKFQSNLQKLAGEVKTAGGIPVLLTPLTRRSFSSGKSTVDDSLHSERLATIAAAKESETHYIDLNAASMAYVNALGKDKSQVFNLDPSDRTHLNDHGGVVFGRMVADLLMGRNQTTKPVAGSCATEEDGFPSGCLAQWFKPDDKMSDAIWQGLPA
ncbi:GDSL-like Lipase/Acylhydrolase [Apodospora peruviana]|uniref:GDSL-like Lipase/Acylhydrolase n=1 Tax=Apodospora peruviana TaxID=516989 RepID=A0AAE0MBB9_9PEZI|nr:GDSL-like Lipase/Acylhydrolase [Apodospora peruviana]